MCVLLFSLKQNGQYPFILAANRDEYYNRPARPANFWPEHPGILAGRDEQSLGTWLGISRGGKFAAITNHCDPSSHDDSRKSRGSLTKDFLATSIEPDDYLASVSAHSSQYNGYGFIFGFLSELCYHSNRGAPSEKLTQGAHGLGNDLLQHPWPKVKLGIKRLSDLASNRKKISPDKLFDILSDKSSRHSSTDSLRPNDRNLPLFVSLANYGTRCSTVIMSDSNGQVYFEERTFDNESRKTMIRNVYRFQIDPS